MDGLFEFLKAHLLMDNQSGKALKWLLAHFNFEKCL